jgi:hypothetical protein
MNKKFKGQGALEYLLLIGGAVLIAVIVIALLVGMGGQSRDTAQEQADRAQQAADVPQPAQIVAVYRNSTACLTNDFTANTIDVNVSWRALGEGGSHEIFLEDNTGQLIANSKILSPNDLLVNIDDVNIGSKEYCGDSYYVYIKTTKNNQTVTSSKFRFGWW